MLISQHPTLMPQRFGVVAGDENAASTSPPSGHGTRVPLLASVCVLVGRLDDRPPACNLLRQKAAVKGRGGAILGGRLGDEFGKALTQAFLAERCSDRGGETLLDFRRRVLRCV